MLVPQSPVIGKTDVVTPIKAVLDQFVRGITDVDRNAVIGGIAITGCDGTGNVVVLAEWDHLPEFPAPEHGHSPAAAPQ